MKLKSFAAVAAAVLLAPLAAVTLPILGAPTAAAAPGVPNDPIALIDEDFEDTINGEQPQMLRSYPGYTSAGVWNNAGQCNGIALSFNSPSANYTDPAGTGTCGAGLINGLRQVARSIALNAGDPNPNANTVVSAYTSGNPGPNLIQLESPAVTVIPGGYYTASVRFGAFSCGAASPIYNFYLVDDANNQEFLIGGPVSACTAAGTTNVEGVRVGNIQSPGSLQWQGSNQLRLRIRNAQGSGTGNDGAVDDLRLVQATPALDKQFRRAGTAADATDLTGVATGEPVTLRFTVTNTSELASKTGITISDQLSPGIQVAPTPNVRNTCAGTVTATAGASTVGVTGARLATDQVSCTIEVDVVSTTDTGVFSNGADDVTSNLVEPTYTATVTVSDPQANDDDAGTNPGGLPFTIDVVDNDTAGDTTYPLDETTVVFPTSGQPTGATVTDGGRTLTIPDVGVYTADPVTGELTFTPDPDYVTGGPLPTISYQISDSNGASRTAQVTAALLAAPVADDEAVTTPFDTPVDIDVLTGDTSDPTAPLDPTSVVFPADGQPAGATISPDGKTLTVPDQGEYVIAADGTVTFTPVDGFEGDTTPVTYQVSDDNGATATGTISVTVGEAPEAVDDTAVGTQGEPVDLDILGNDTTDPDTELDPASVVFPAAGQPAGATISPDGKTLTVADEGEYVLAADGSVTFTPVDDFVGDATPVTYQVADGNGALTTATIAVSITATPVANDDTDTTPFGEAVTTDVLGNDTDDPDADLDPTSVVFPAGGQPAGATVSPDGKTLTVPGEGEYVIDPVDGAVTFTPEDGFDGVAAAVTYQVTDANGGIDTATLTVTVRPAPQANDDVVSTPIGTPIDITVLGNDVADPADPLDPTSVVFPTGGQPAGSVVSADGRTLTIDGTGEFVIDPVSGVVTFTPEAGFFGPVPAVTYQVTDANGLATLAQISVTVGDPPIAGDDTATTPFGTATDPIDVLANDFFAADDPVDPTLVVFPLADQPTGATISPDGKTLTIGGVGEYTIDPATGAVVFTPASGFSGPAPDVTYRVTTESGATTTAQLSVDVGDPVVADDDTDTTPAGQSIEVDVLANDTSDPDADLDPTSVVFSALGQPVGSTISDGGKTLTVPGEGVYTVDPVSGAITFDPDPTFGGRDATPVSYDVTDADGLVDSATLTITVGPVPTAQSDAVFTSQNVPTTVDVLGNDNLAPGGNAVDLDPTTVVFPTTGQSADAVVSADGRTLTIAGVGEYVIDPVNGEITFTPVAAFVGAAPAVTYQVADLNGAVASAQLTVGVGASPVAADDTAFTPFGEPTDPIDLLTNDVVDPDNGNAPDPTSVVFPVDGQPAGATISPDGKTLTVPDQGEYVIDPDSGEVVFTPADGFSGVAAAVTYQVDDTAGGTATAQLTVTVGAAPQAIADTARTAQGEPTDPIDVLGNDTADTTDGNALDPTSVVFPTAGQPAGATVSADGKTLTVPGEGEYVIDPVDGTVTFTPEAAFTGGASPVTYQVADGNGALATSTITVAVGNQPLAIDDVVTTPFGQPTAFDPTANDSVDPSTQLDPLSVVFPTGGQPAGAVVSPDGKTLTLNDVGQFVIDPGSGQMVFTPADGFTGAVPPVAYTFSDTDGRTATPATIAVAVGAAAVGADDVARTQANTPVTVPVIANDAVDPTATIDPASVVFPTAGQPAGATISTDGRELTVPGEGTYVVDPATGAVTFTPVDGFSGVASAVTYQFADEDGVVGSAALTITVADPVVAVDDSATTPFGQPVSVSVLTNDTTGADQPFDVDSVTFPDVGQPAGTTVSDDGRTLTVPGEGEYVIGADGAVTFTPADGFSGEATPVTYQVTNAEGITRAAQLTVGVGPTPVAADDRARTGYNTSVDIDVLANDTGDGLDPSSVVFPTSGQPDGATVSADGKRLTVPGEGVYTIDPTTGVVSFDPDPRFSGRTTSAVTYQVTDANGLVAAGTLRVAVAAGPPAVARPDEGETSQGDPVTIDPTDNDRPSPGETIDRGSVVFPDDDQPDGAVVSDDGKQITVPGEGVWVIGDDGRVTFTPEPGFTGRTSPVTYRVTDTGGTVLSSTITVEVRGGSTDAPGGSDGSGGGGLSDTGGPALPLGLLGLGLLTAGAVVLVIRRRRT